MLTATVKWSLISFSFGHKLRQGKVWRWVDIFWNFMPVHPYAMAKALCFQVFSVQLEGKGYKLAPTFADKHVNLLLDYKHDAVIIVWLNQTGIPLNRATSIQTEQQWTIILHISWAEEERSKYLFWYRIYSNLTAIIVHHKTYLGRKQKANIAVSVKKIANLQPINLMYS